MPYCPNCRTEYREGIVTCADCEVPLVTALPEVSHAAPPLELLLRTADAELLPVVLSALDAAGIPCWTEGAESAALLPLGPGTASTFTGVGAELFVPSDRLDEARALLEAVETGSEDLPPELREGPEA